MPESAPRQANKNSAEIAPGKLTEVVSNIMSLQEYSELGHTSWPYTYEMHSGERHLHYFGSSHPGNDIDHPEYRELEEVFRAANPDIVIVEGANMQSQERKKAFTERLNALSHKESVARYSETGLAIKLATENNIDWVCPEPTLRSQIEHVLQSQTKEEVFAWYVLRHLPQYQRNEPKNGFETYSQTFIESFKSETNWPDFDYTYDHALRVAEHVVGDAIDVEHIQDASALVDPIPWKGRPYTTLNRINATVSRFRDEEIVRTIAKTLEQHKNVLVVYGGSHAVMQEPALRALLS